MIHLALTFRRSVDEIRPGDILDNGLYKWSCGAQVGWDSVECRSKINPGHRWTSWQRLDKYTEWDYVSHDELQRLINEGSVKVSAPQGDKDE